MSSKIQVLIMDVDGSLTDGKIYMGPNGEAMKAFSIKDGYAVESILKPNDIVPIVLTARISPIVQKRCDELGIKEVYQGKTDKLEVIKEIIGEQNFGKCAYFGDDLIDLQCMLPIKRAGGVIGCPADAVQEIRAIADYVCFSKAGEGSLREFAEWIVSGYTETEVLRQKVNFAIKYIRDIEKSNLGLGTYPVNEFLHLLVQEYDTKDEKECITESHRKYVDIQWIEKGKEEICVSDISQLYLEKEYCDEKDIAIWRSSHDMMRIVLTEGSYIVLYPTYAHKGGIAVEGTIQVRKIVGKVKI